MNNEETQDPKEKENADDTRPENEAAESVPAARTRSSTRAKKPDPITGTTEHKGLKHKFKEIGRAHV